MEGDNVDEPTPQPENTESAAPPELTPQGTQASPQAGPDDELGVPGPDDELGVPGTDDELGVPGTDGADDTTKKRISPWVWVGVGVAVLVVAALVYYSAQSTEGDGGLAFLFGRRTTTVPSVVGQTQTDAQNAITAAGFSVGQVSQLATLDVAPGLVVEQSPSAETKAKEGSAVDISVATIPGATVPNVVGKTESAASEMLAEEGLRIGTVSYVYSSSAAAGEITTQDPSAGTEVSVGAAVSIKVSKGKETDQVPNVVGLSESDAESTLKGAGFTVTTTKAANANVPPGDVISQSPAAGTVVAPGSSVTITVSTGEPSAPKATVPDLVGKSVADAFNALQNANLKMNIKFAASADYVLKVAEQEPGSGTSVDQGTVVTVTIGLPSFTFEKPSISTTSTPEPTSTTSPSELTSGTETTSGP